jgi:cytochrome c556
MIRIVLAAAVLGLGVSALVAQTDPIEARKALMQENGKQGKVAIGMIEGKRPFNLEEAKKVFASFIEAGEKEPALFPDDSKEGKTRALPAIWENKADFTARFAKLVTDSKAGSEATKDLETFKAQVIMVDKNNCDPCHERYRRPGR